MHLLMLTLPSALSLCGARPSHLCREANTMKGHGRHSWPDGRLHVGEWSPCASVVGCGTTAAILMGVVAPSPSCSVQTPDMHGRYVWGASSGEGQVKGRGGDRRHRSVVGMGVAQKLA